jgi:hypothetical protein
VPLRVGAQAAWFGVAAHTGRVVPRLVPSGARSAEPHVADARLVARGTERVVIVFHG